MNELEKMISDLKNPEIIKNRINEFLEKESQKTNEQIKDEIKFKNENPDLFIGTIFEQMLKRLNFERRLNERTEKIY